MSFPLISIVTSQPFCDASGAPLTGQLLVTPTSKFRLPNGGQALAGAIGRQLQAGLLVQPSSGPALQLANPALTSPVGIGYNFTVRDTRGDTETWSSVLIVPDANGAYDLAQLNTGQFVTAVPQTVISITGGNGAAMVTLAAGAVAVSQYQVIAVVNGVAVAASSDAVAQIGAVAGVATGSVPAGAALSIQSTGPITNPGWSFTSGQPVFLSPTGALTQAAPTSGYLQVLGVAVAPTTVLLSLQEPIEFPTS